MSHSPATFLSCTGLHEFHIQGRSVHRSAGRDPAQGDCVSYMPGEDSSARSYLCTGAESAAVGARVGRAAPGAAGRSAGPAPAGTCPAGSAGGPAMAASCASELRLSRSPAMLTPRSPACSGNSLNYGCCRLFREDFWPALCAISYCRSPHA